MKARGLLWAMSLTTSFGFVALLLVGLSAFAGRWGFAGLFLLVALCEFIAGGSYRERLEVEKAKDSDEALIEYLRTVIVDFPKKEDR